MREFEVTYERINGGETEKRTYSEEIVALEILAEIEPSEIDNVYAVFIDGSIHSLNHTIRSDASISFITYKTSTGEKMYETTLKYVFLMALKILYKDTQVKISNKLGRDMFFRVTAGDIDVDTIKQKMLEIISLKLPIERHEVHRKELEARYEEMGYVCNIEKDMQFNNRYKIYSCDYYDFKYYNYLYSRLLPNTKHIKHFDIIQYMDGILLRMPMKGDNNKAQEKPKKSRLFELLNENSFHYSVEYVNELNENLKIPKASTGVMQKAESFHHTRFDRCAEEIIKKNARFVFLAGPSSAGKTTSANRISEKLANRGKKSIVIGMDDFFLNFEDSPLINGKKNLDAITHVDLKLFREVIIDLLRDKEVKLPKYEFTLNQGERTYPYAPVKIDNDTIIIVEGIHALNPLASDFIDKKNIYNVYVAPIVTLSYDPFTKVSSNMVRLTRRIVRDYYTRGRKVEETFQSWKDVLEGERENIYPFLKHADYIINTTLNYEMSVLKPLAKDLVLNVPDDSKWNYLAKEVFRTIERFKDLNDSLVPFDSILREFIGNSCYYPEKTER